MTEKVSISMERIFLHYILENHQQFNKVPPYFFKDKDIKFIYEVVRNYYLSKDTDRTVPPKQQILTMVRNVESDVITPPSNNLITKILSGNNDSHEESYLKSKFESWKLTNKMRDNVLKSIEIIRSAKDLDFDNIKEIAHQFKLMTGELDTICDDDDDLGDDFDDIENHVQDFDLYKIATGWSCIDTVMQGGWDVGSLSVLVGPTNSGKTMWMNNIAVNAIQQGKNVIFITLEMQSHKCMKRMGSMHYKIPIDEYDERSRDKTYMKTQFNKVKKRGASNGIGDNLFEDKKIGKLIVKKFPTGRMTVTDLNLFIQKVKEARQINIDMVIVDYISIMGIEKGVNVDMLFLKGKHLAEGLRAVADIHNVAMITATQTGKDVWDANDIGLKDIPESKAIAETADSAWGIIRNPEMKKNNKYRLKPLKLRDGDYGSQIVEFDFNTKYLTIENDKMVEV